MANNFEVNQSMELLTPKKSQAYPIQKEEWLYIKEKITSLGARDDSHSSIGFLLVGGGISGVFSILSQPTFGFYWVLTVCCFICGWFSLRFAKLTAKSQNGSSETLVEYMEIIEERFCEAPTPLPSITASLPLAAQPQPIGQPREKIKETIRQNPEKTASDIAVLSGIDKSTVAGYISSLYLAKEIKVIDGSKPKKFKLT